MRLILLIVALVASTVFADDKGSRAATNKTEEAEHLHTENAVGMSDIAFVGIVAGCVVGVLVVVSAGAFLLCYRRRGDFSTN
uniref:Uncharacterized protein n=1 Tax=Plectus sambesii TaxID=2011161 RepID=A0A914W9P4_9BILA